jgi:hypothetical protein
MRVSTLVVVLFASSVSAFGPMRVAPSAALPRARIIRAGVYDVWYAERRARNRVYQGGQARVPAKVPDPLELDVDSVTLVLMEFVRSDYAYQKFDLHRVQGTDYGEIFGMFDSMRLDAARLVVRLKPVFDERNTALLDRLAMYLCARIPQLVELHAIHRDGLDIYSPPRTSTRSPTRTALDTARPQQAATDSTDAPSPMRERHPLSPPGDTATPARPLQPSPRTRKPESAQRTACIAPPQDPHIY